MGNWNKITEQQIEEMKIYHDMGLNSVQIAEEMHLSITTVRRYVRKIFGPERPRKTVSSELKEKMKTLRAKGLSNSKIAKECDVSYSTVVSHLGLQPTMTRAEYGEIISHPTGESFDKQPDISKKTKLRILQTTIDLEGNIAQYTVTDAGLVTIRVPHTGMNYSLDKDQLYSFIAELCDIGEWLTKNGKKTEDIRLDGKPELHPKQVLI